MAEKSYESIYMGSYNPLDPNYGPLFTGYRVPFHRLGATTSIQTANQVAEVTQRLNEGIKVVELAPISPDVFEGIPEQHWKEAERLGKLTGAEMTLHAPIIDPAGFTREGWSENHRKESEIRFEKAIERAHQLNPKGNTPVVIHATAGIPAIEWKTVNGKPQQSTFYIVNRETGQLSQPIELKQKFFPKEEIPTPEKELDEINTRGWKSNMDSIIHNKMIIDSHIQQGWPMISEQWESWKKGEIRKDELVGQKETALNMVDSSIKRYELIDMQVQGMFNEAMKFAPKEKTEEVKKTIIDARKDWEEAHKFIETNPYKFTEGYDRVLQKLKLLPAPQTYITTTEFALENSKKTIANAALDSYRKYGDNSPIISIENFMPNMVFGRSSELKKLIEESRKQFVEEAQKRGISADKARSAAGRIIGATWDVGHINFLRKHGFGEKEGMFNEEEYKKIIREEAKTIAPFVKHVHLTDNFGFEDAHLPPGMGGVPFKEHLEELEKAGFKGKEIVEAGGFVAQFKTSPTPYFLEALGSPLYSMHMQPFWNQVRNTYGIPAGYSSGYGMILPEQHFSIYGTGFAALPLELGGAIPGKGQRFSGAPME